jgi:hypothetical protein
VDDDEGKYQLNLFTQPGYNATKRQQM